MLRIFSKILKPSEGNAANPKHKTQHTNAQHSSDAPAMVIMKYDSDFSIANSLNYFPVYSKQEMRLF